MKNIFLAILAFLPILFVLFFVYARGLRKLHVLPTACLAASLIALLFWRVHINQILASLIQGLWRSVETILAMYSSLFFVEVLKQTGVFFKIHSGFTRLSADRRIQMIIIAWFFGSGLENVLGFGLTCGVCSFLLMAIGFPPACSFMLSMMGPVAASSFSMVGLPVFFGARSGLDYPEFTQQLALVGMSWKEYLNSVVFHTAIFNGIAGTFIPLFMIMMMTHFFGRMKKWSRGLSMAPFAIFCGLAFTIPFTLTTIFMGPEFASLIGATVGLALAIAAIHFDFLIPHHHVWDFRDTKAWEADWSAGKLNLKLETSTTSWRAWIPFGILTILVVLTRFFYPFSHFLKHHIFKWTNIFGTSVGITSQPIYLSCAIALFATLVVMIIIYRLGVMKIAAAFCGTCGGTWAAIINWTFIMPLAAIYINSGANHSGLPSMIDIMIQSLTHIPGGNFWGPVLSPILGAIGAFFSESNTLSTMILASTQHSLSQNLGLPSALFMALQISGASAGNMIAMHYLVRGGIMVGMLGWESPMSRKTIYPVMWYVAIVGFLGIIAVNLFSFSDPFVKARSLNLSPQSTPPARYYKKPPYPSKKATAPQETTMRFRREPR